MIDDDGAAGRQRHLPRVGGLDLVLDLEPREERNVVLVELHAVHGGRHDVAHELLRLLVDRFGVDQELADVRMEIVADRADDEARFLVDEERAGLQFRGVFDRAPQLHQVVQVPLQLFGAAADAGCARDDAHPCGDVEPVDRIAQLVALLALDAARHAAAARIVRHQHEIAAGERDVRRERRALVAALVLVDLDDQLHAFLELILDAPAAAAVAFVAVAVGIGAAAALEVLARDLLEWQKAVAFGAVIDEARFEAGLDAGDDGLVDVALALFLARGFDVEVDQLLAVDDGHPELLRLGGVEQHAFHGCFPGADPAGRAARRNGGRALARRDAIGRRTRAKSTAPAAVAAGRTRAGWTLSWFRPGVGLDVARWCDLVGVVGFVIAFKRSSSRLSGHCENHREDIANREPGTA